MSESVVDMLKKVEARDAALAVIWFLSVIGPGFLTIFLYLPQVATDYDFLKILVFSASLSLPVIAFNLLIFYSLSHKHEKSMLNAHWISASLTSMLSFYASLYAGYYFHLHFPSFALTLFLSNLVLALSLASIIRFGDATAPSK